MSERHLRVATVVGHHDHLQDPPAETTWWPKAELARALAASAIDLLATRQLREIAEGLAERLRRLLPELSVRVCEIRVEAMASLEAHREALRAYLAQYPVADDEELAFDISTENPAATIVMHELVSTGVQRARLVVTSPVRAYPPCQDLDLARGFAEPRAEQAASKRHDDQLRLQQGIPTRNPVLARRMQSLERIVTTCDVPILLTGPTGTGKTTLVDALYELKRKYRGVRGELVAVNCATLGGPLAMAALFGSARGSFTGSVENRLGLLKRADGGVLFLDEIGELPLESQAMLLKAIEEHRYLPVGADREVESRFHLIAGTSRDLRAEVAAGRFRADLFYRIAVFATELPALRDRREDLPGLLDRELQRVAASLMLPFRMDPAGRARFFDFAVSPRARWSGNHRDIRACATRLVVFAIEGVATVEVMAEEEARLLASWALDVPASPAGDDLMQPRRARAALGEDAAEHTLAELGELELILRACEISDNLSEAGRRLHGHEHRRLRFFNDAQRISRRLRKFKLTKADVRFRGQIPW